MKIGSTTHTFAVKYGDEEGIKRLAKAGFDSLDFGMFRYPAKGEVFGYDDSQFEELFRKLGATAVEAGIEINQVHSPTPSYTGDAEEDEFLFGVQVRSIKAASYLGSPYIIIHPAIPREYRYTHFRAETKEINMRFYGRLIPYLEEYNVKLAIENMFNYDPIRKCVCPTVCSTAEEMLDYIYTLNSDRFVACLDIGHANLTGDTPQNMIRILGDTLETLHVHDNNGLTDQHIAPFMGTIDWKEVTKALTDINYSGVFSFETDSYYRMFENADLDASAVFLRKLGVAIINGLE